MRVLIIGASRNPERYSYLAMKRLEAAGHEVLLYNPGIDDIEGRPVVRDLALVTGPVDTVTLYANPAHLEPLADRIITLSPRRIISNPGTESAVIQVKAAAAGVEYLEACTLVLLSTGQF